MRLFIDHCVPESVAKVLEDAGHHVIRLREKTSPDSPDALVAAVAEANDAVLVTMDADFKGLAARAGLGRRRFRDLILAASTSDPSCPDLIRASSLLAPQDWIAGTGSPPHTCAAGCPEGPAMTTGEGAQRRRHGPILGAADLSLIRFERCRESQAATRMKAALSLIEHEWTIGAGQSDRRMFVVITGETIRTHR